ncbi:ABC transporter permease [Kaistia sp. 32K]|uniref:ABC transporter permease n=1 Tax=Kaistia sp. 32K TaxID=2795690 RepID=UPI0019154658|nr:ABC transporter permease [Kaistia sp. 32K]BCP54015.1 ABC transporter permease [Kaistia sp. 32K]
MRSIPGLAIRRVIAGAPTLAGIVIVSFLMTRVLPGDPAVYFAGAAPTPEAIADLRRTLQLDLPLWQQFLAYIGQLSRGDLGRSLVTGQPVTADLLARLPNTLELTLTALLIAVIVAIPLGVQVALHRGRALDHAFRVGSTIVLSVPGFFSALILVFVFYYQLDWAPAPLGRLDPMAFEPPTRTGFLLIDALLVGDWGNFRDALAHMMLPAIALALTAVGPLARITRASMLAVLSSDYVRAARSHDLPRRTIIYVYALRNALLPVLTTAGFVLSYLISANVVIEKVFGWPGVGTYALDALASSDYAAVQGFILAIATLYLAVSIVLDILAATLDVRTRIAN